MSDDFFAPPPFEPAGARASLARTLRDLRLVERNGAFELNGQPVVRAAIEGAALRLDVARRPSRSPDWDRAVVDDHAKLRRFTDDLRRRLSRWADGRDAE
jgi:hypothetical protein